MISRKRRVTQTRVTCRMPTRMSSLQRTASRLDLRSRPLTASVKPIVILGSGMAGLGAASALAAEGMPGVCYDKNAYYGGHTATFGDPNGFLFDEGPHVSFTTNARIQELFAQNVDHRFETVRAHIN